MEIVQFSIILLLFKVTHCDDQIGPDPWNHKISLQSQDKEDTNVPPDLRYTVKKIPQVQNHDGLGGWFYKRILSVLLKGGQLSENEDGTVNINIHMKIDQQRWENLNQYIKSETPLSEEMYRRSCGYIEDSIHKPSVAERIVLAWTEYVEMFLIEYKMYIVWTLILLATLITFSWLWKRVSHKHIIPMIAVMLYLYEVFVSYKEVEQLEYERFLSAINSCKWYFWTSDCELPSPDPLVFIKYMNPLKIAIRMFSHLIFEPMHEITDGLWYPLNKVLYAGLVMCIFVLLITLFVMSILSTIFNIPFSFNVFAGLLSFNVKQRSQTLNSESGTIHSISHEDRVSGQTLNKILDLCSHALNTTDNNTNNRLALNGLDSNRASRSNTRFQLGQSSNASGMKRSSSTGRLPDSRSVVDNPQLALSTDLRKRRVDGGGDAF